MYALYMKVVGIYKIVKVMWPLIEDSLEDAMEAADVAKKRLAELKAKKEELTGK